VVTVSIFQLFRIVNDAKEASKNIGRSCMTFNINFVFLIIIIYGNLFEIVRISFR
jgi:hypothetical protein